MCKKFLEALILSSLAMPLLASQLVIKNANIYTVDEKQPTAQALAVDKGKIVFVGTNKEVEKFIKKQTKVVDAKKNSVLPGFVESHIHPAVAALFNQTLNVMDVTSKKQMVERIKNYLKEHPNKKALVGFGWNPAIFTNPSKEVLDLASKNIPILLIAADAHSAWVNTKALEVLNITSKTADPQPGVHYYKRDKKGNPTGWFLEASAFWPHARTLGFGESKQMQSALEEFLPILSSFGITTLYDAGVPGLEKGLTEALKSMEKSGKLNIRYGYSRFILNHEDAKKAFDDYKKLELEASSAMYWPAALKITNDGTIEVKTARLMEPYLDEEHSHGATLFNSQQMKELIHKADLAGIPTHIHAIGDFTSHDALNAIENARKINPKSKIRHTVCHLQLMKKDDITKFAKLDVIAQVSPQWVQDATGNITKYWNKILGEKRAKSQFAFRTMWNAKAVVAMGSDFPASGVGLLESSPMYGLENGITRASSGIESKPVYKKEEALSLEQLIKAATLNGAYQLNKEKELGSITVGKNADIIILNKNIFDVPTNEIHKVKVNKTIVNGEIIYSK